MFQLVCVCTCVYIHIWQLSQLNACKHPIVVQHCTHKSSNQRLAVCLTYQPPSLNPHPSTPIPQPQSPSLNPNPHPSTPIPQSPSLNPHPSTHIPQPTSLNPHPSTPIPISLISCLPSPTQVPRSVEVCATEAVLPYLSAPLHEDRAAGIQG